MTPKQRQQVRRIIADQCRAASPDADDSTLAAAASLIMDEADEARLLAILKEHQQGAEGRQVRAWAGVKVIQDCFALSLGDNDAALSAAQQIMDGASDEELRRLAEEAGYKPRWMRRRDRQQERQRVRDDRDRQLEMLDVLDAELRRRRGVRMALEGALCLEQKGWIMLSLDEEERKDRDVTLYGIGGVMQVFQQASTELGRAARAYAETEGAGHRGAGALDTAKEQARPTGKATRSKGARGKARKRRGLPRSLRTKEEWRRPDELPWQRYYERLRREQL